MYITYTKYIALGKTRFTPFREIMLKVLHLNDDIIPVEEGYPLVWFCACASHWPCCQGKAGLVEM